ncbi:MAG: hypothetical protein J6P03_07985, partial [Opitutales bacterium]|nr:hypothetical protein [Opitutales bacterium]
KGGLAVFLSSFAVVALVETVLMRVNIFVISSLIPNNLSPYFPTESSWLSGKPYSDLAEKIRASGFKKLFSARNFNSDGSECDMLTVFSNEGGSVIARVIFENYGGGVYATYMFCSKICPNPGSGARYIVSSNMALARGFKHASDVLMRRYPFVSGFFKLLKIHQKRLADSGRPAASLENLTLERVQEYLDRTFIFNVDSGILNAEKDAAELGVWTDEGKYRLWVETILLSYFGAAPD